MIFRKDIRQIVDGKLYDTKTAKLVLEYQIHHMWVGVVRERLYKSENGWFCVINGDIIVRSDDYAKSILSKRSVDKYIEYFGEPKLA